MPESFNRRRVRRGTATEGAGDDQLVALACELGAGAPACAFLFQYRVFYVLFLCRCLVEALLEDTTLFWRCTQLLCASDIIAGPGHSSLFWNGVASQR